MTALDYIVGTDGTGLFFAKLAVALVGAFLLSLWGTQKAVKKAPYSPDTFSWRYFIMDNARKIVADVLVIAIGVRFILQFIPSAVDVELQLLASLGMGLSVDRLTAYIKKKAKQQKYGEQ